MKKIGVKYFATAITTLIAVFIFSITFAAPQARAYAVGSTTTSITPGATGAGNSAAGTSYDFGSSLQNLISPFTGFVNSLKFNNNTTVSATGINNAVSGTGFSWPTINLAPVLESTVQNTLSQWVSQFDNWFYGVTGVQLSGIMVAILGVFAWALGLAQQAVNWLLVLFH